MITLLRSLAQLLDIDTTRPGWIYVTILTARLEIMKLRKEAR